MPSGLRTCPDGDAIDFERIYRELIRPALEDAGMHIVRGSAGFPGGESGRADLQSLVIADLVLVDLSTDDPDVWYQLGIRHALRPRGVVLVSGGRPLDAFTRYTDRTLIYRLRDAVPDAMRVRADRERLCDMVEATRESWHGHKGSPVFHLMPHLPESGLEGLRVDAAGEFWEQHGRWQQRLDHACRHGRVGDLLVLADEAPVAAFRAAAWIRAGEVLRRQQCCSFALEQLEKGLAITPHDPKGLHEKGRCLHQLALDPDSTLDFDAVRSHFRAMLQQAPSDADTWWLLGRVEEDAWRAGWQNETGNAERRRELARAGDTVLRAAINCYETAFRGDHKHYRAGARALLLMRLYEHLTGATFYRTTFDDMLGAVRFAAQCENGAAALYQARACLAELQMLSGSTSASQKAYEGAAAICDSDWHALDATRSSLQLLRTMGIEDERIETGMTVLDRSMERLARPQRDWQPRQVFLFVGHPAVAGAAADDAHLPADKLETAKAQIAELLGELGGGADDLGLTQGACGGDLLFTEVCQAQGIRVSWLQPQREADFTRHMAGDSDSSCHERYLEARQKLGRPILSMPQELGELPAETDYDYRRERCNLWLLNTALAWGPQKVQFICLWNGSPSDGPGGMARLYEEISRRTGQVHWIDTRNL